MHIPFAKEVLPFLIGSLVVFGGLALVCWRLSWRKTMWVFCALALIGAAYMLYFFRDPLRFPPQDPTAVLSGADGVIMGVKEVYEEKYLKVDTVRISIFLSLFDVHVNRAPIAGRIGFLGYFPGKRFFTFQEKSSEFNQHNSILIEGVQTRCLVKQIVGPVARRVVYWLHLDQEVKAGDRIGMMKFSSRLDIYLPKDDVEVVVKPGDKVVAGLTVVARLKNDL